MTLVIALAMLIAFTWFIDHRDASTSARWAPVTPRSTGSRRHLDRRR